jgi:hypothetical protein
MDLKAHVDAIESASSLDNEQHHNDRYQVKKGNSANEEIIEHLQTTGEEVGMTLRSIMAAFVRLNLPYQQRHSN